jgi:hypothetical protein
VCLIVNRIDDRAEVLPQAYDFIPVTDLRSNTWWVGICFQ